MSFMKLTEISSGNGAEANVNDTTDHPPNDISTRKRGAPGLP